MARGRRPSGLDVQVDQRGDTRLLQLGWPEIRGVHFIEPTQQMPDGVVDMGGLAAGGMQAECDGAIFERRVGHDAEVDDRDLATALGVRLQGALKHDPAAFGIVGRGVSWRAPPGARAPSSRQSDRRRSDGAFDDCGRRARIVGRHIDCIADDMGFQLVTLAVKVDPAWPRCHRPAGCATADDETETRTGLVEKHGALAATASCLDLALNNCGRQADLTRAAARLRESIGGRHGGSHLAEGSRLPKQLHKQSWVSYGKPR